jgi:hypothetical protein
MYRQVNKGGQGKQVTGFSQSRRDKEPKTPNISYQNLFAYYDFGDGKSYSGSGTTLNDLSGNGNTVTLVNTPTYSNVYNGVETFNSTNTRGTATLTSGSTSALTFIAFIKRNGTVPQYGTLMVSRSGGSGANDAGLSYRDSFQTMAYVWGSSSANYFFDSGLTPPLNQWCMVAAAIDTTGGTIYLNNRSVNNTTTNSTITWGQNFIFGNDISPLSRGCNGDIGIGMIYKRKLTHSEIMQIFEAYRPRYGI